MINLNRLFIASLVFLASATPAFAQSEGDGSQFNKLINVVLNIIDVVQNFLFDLAGILAVGVIAIAGFYYVTGNVDTAKKAITAGIIGLIIVAATWVIIGLVTQFTPHA
jgi:hypothetical protein